MAIRTGDPRLASYTTNAPPAEAIRALVQSGRAVATENRSDEVLLATSSGAALSSRSFADVFRGEQPVRAKTPRNLGRSTAAAAQKPDFHTQQEVARESAGRLTPEKPRHSWIGKGSTDPFRAAATRTQRKRAAWALGRPRDPVLLAGGVNPIDHANGLTTPDRGRMNVNQRSAKPGTPTPVLELPDELVTEAAGGGGLTQFAFLAGAVLVAWLALK